MTTGTTGATGTTGVTGMTGTTGTTGTRYTGQLVRQVLRELLDTGLPVPQVQLVLREQQVRVRQVQQEHNRFDGTTGTTGTSQELRYYGAKLVQLELQVEPVLRSRELPVRLVQLEPQVLQALLAQQVHWYYWNNGK